MNVNELMTRGRVVTPAAELPPERPLGGDHAGLPPYLEVAEFVPQPPAPTPSTGPPDPPIFLLQASPTWQGGVLPDGVWQRVQIGATGQVLTVQADGSIAWVTGGGGFSNPMTTLGDLITGGAAGAPARLPVGSNGQVLEVVAGVPTWSSGVLTNPMTALDDVIVGGVAGAPVRLAVGPVGSMLSVSPSGHTVWNGGPMSTVGDMMYATSPVAVPGRIPIGSNGQVLTVVAGVPTWAASSSGFPNPMTSTGDIITATAGGTAQRLGVGTAGQVLTVSGGTPTWATPGTGALPFTVVFPTNDTSGVTDQANIQAAITSLAAAANPEPGGIVWLAPGNFYVKPTSGNIALNLYQQQIGSGTLGNGPVSLHGAGGSATTIFPVGAAVTCIYMHRSVSYGGQFGHPAQQATGTIRGLTIDGTNTTGASIGLDWGDGWGYVFDDLHVSNFNTAGAIGVQQVNRLFWTEKSGPIHIGMSNNTTAMYITTALAPTGDHSCEYNTYFLEIFCQANQQGVVVDGVNMGGSHLWLQGNMSLSNGSLAAPPGNIAALSIINAAGVTPTDGHRWYEGSFWIKVEANPGNGTGTTYPYLMYSDGTGFVRMCSGAIYQSNLTNSVWNGAEFSFAGPIGDPNLATAWPSVALPATGVAWANKGPNALVCITGGTVSDILLGGNTSGGLQSGAFFVPAGGTLTVNYTAAPSFKVVSAAEPANYRGSY